MQNKPLVSIIVPCYNQQDFVSEALETVYKQTYSNWECIIINDGSTDNSEKEIQKWISKDSRFKYYYKENGGICETRNTGIKYAQGKYILPLDADDLIEPPYVEEAINELEKDKSVKLVYCNKIYFGAINKKTPCPPYSFEVMLYENLIHHAAIFRRSDYEQTRGYNNNMYDGLEDWDFWIELLNPEDKVIKLDGYYYHYRIKKISRSTQIDKETNERLILQMFKNHQDKYLQFFNPVRDRINHLYYREMTDRLLNSAEYKIGETLYLPFRLIAKIFNRIFR